MRIPIGIFVPVLSLSLLTGARSQSVSVEPANPQTQGVFPPQAADPEKPPLPDSVQADRKAVPARPRENQTAEGGGHGGMKTALIIGVAVLAVAAVVLLIGSGSGGSGGGGY
jgi:hypothetical protein